MKILFYGGIPLGAELGRKQVNMMTNKKQKENDLKRIPGIGKKIEQHLFHIGIKTIDDLKGKDPEDLYLRDSLYKGFQDDRCLLYVYRLAVYYAENDSHEAEKLKWWYWKDEQ